MPGTLIYKCKICGHWADIPADDPRVLAKALIEHACEGGKLIGGCELIGRKAEEEKTD